MAVFAPFSVRLSQASEPLACQVSTVLIEALTGCRARSRLGQLSLSGLTRAPAPQQTSVFKLVRENDLAGSSAVPLNPPCAIDFGGSSGAIKKQPPADSIPTALLALHP